MTITWKKHLKFFGTPFILLLILLMFISITGYNRMYSLSLIQLNNSIFIIYSLFWQLYVQIYFLVLMIIDTIKTKPIPKGTWQKLTMKWKLFIIGISTLFISVLGSSLIMSLVFFHSGNYTIIFVLYEWRSLLGDSRNFQTVLNMCISYYGIDDILKIESPVNTYGLGKELLLIQQLVK